MKRSVILMGGKTHVISLPSQWIKKFSIKKGEELDLDVVDNTVIVRRDSPAACGSVEINLVGMDRMLRRVVAATYKSGYDDIKILFQDREQLGKIEKVLHNACIGFEISRQGENYVVVKNLAPVDPNQYSNSLRRLFFTLEIMQEDLLRALESGKIDALQDVVAKDEQVNRLADMCRRIINSGNGRSLNKPSVQYYVIEQLERIGDLHKKIAEYALKKPTPVNDELRGIMEEILSFFKKYHKLFYSFNLSDIENFGLEFYAIRNKIRNSNPNDSSYPLIMYQEFVLENIFDMNGALLTLNI